MHKGLWFAFAATLVLALPKEAKAFGMGTSMGFSDGTVFGGDFGDGGAMSFAPSLDLVIDPSAVLQIHALETVGAAIDGSLFLGANLYFGVASLPVAGKWNAVVQPGGSLDLIGDPTTVIFAGEARFGIQAHDAAGFGLYLVPAIGLAASDGNAELFTGGALQISVWFNL